MKLRELIRHDQLPLDTGTYFSPLIDMSGFPSKFPFISMANHNGNSTIIRVYIRCYLNENQFQESSSSLPAKSMFTTLSATLEDFDQPQEIVPVLCDYIQYGFEVTGEGETYDLHICFYDPYAPSQG